MKKVFLKISQNSQKQIGVTVSLLIKLQGGSPFFDTFFVLVDVITTIIENVELDLLNECVSIYELIEVFQKLSCFLAKLPPVFFLKTVLKNVYHIQFLNFVWKITFNADVARQLIQ